MSEISNSNNNLYYFNDKFNDKFNLKFDFNFKLNLKLNFNNKFNNKFYNKFNDKLKFIGKLKFISKSWAKLGAAILMAILLSILLSMLTVAPLQASYQELEGDDIYISALEEEDEYLFEVRGNALFKTEDFEITGEEADFHSLKQELEFRRNVIFSSADIWVSADSLFYELARERALFSGAARLKYQGMDATAEEVEHLGQEEMLYLTGGVEGVRNGEEFSAREVEVNLAEETINLKGQARIRLPGGEE